MTKYTKIVSVAALATAFPATLLAQDNSLSCGQTYTVSSGDTLSGINQRAYGHFRFDALYQANIEVVGANPNLIFIGQRLTIPCEGGETTVAATAPATTPPVEVELASAVQTEVEPVTPAAPLVFSFNKTSAPKFILNSGIIDLYLAEIAEVTEGRVRFIDPDEMNRDPRAQFDLVTSGAVDGAYVFNGHLAASHPLLQLPMVPLMGGSAEQTATSLWRLHDTYLSDTSYFDDAHLLGFVAAPAAHIWRLSDQPVTVETGIADQNNYAIPYFEGLDTRGPKIVQDENMMRISAFDEGTNGTLTFFMAHGAARAAGVWTDDRTVTEVDNGLYTPTFSVILSNEAWEQISAADRAAITEISGEKLASRSASWDLFDNGHRQHMLDTGLNIDKPSSAVLAQLDGVSQAGQQTWVEQANAMGIAGSEAVEAYKSDLASLQDLLIFR